MSRFALAFGGVSYAYSRSRSETDTFSDGLAATGLDFFLLMYAFGHLPPVRPGIEVLIP